MHFYLWGAESRGLASIIAGRVAADRKNRPICSSSFAAAYRGGREYFECRFGFLSIIYSLLFNSVRCVLYLHDEL